MRVLTEGEVVAGQPFMLVERPYPDWTVARAFRAMRRRSIDRDEAARLRELPTISQAWRLTLSQI
jgi:MOSC domain-containing protein YiiM